MSCSCSQPFAWKDSMAMLMAGARNSFSLYAFDETYPIANILPFAEYDEVTINITTTSTDSSILFVRIRSGLVDGMYEIIVLFADKQWRALSAKTSTRFPNYMCNFNPVTNKLHKCLMCFSGDMVRCKLIRSWLSRNLNRRRPLFGEYGFRSFVRSSSSQASPIILGRRNGFGFPSSMLSCPICPTGFTPHLSFLFYNWSFHQVLFLPLHLCSATGASNIAINTDPSFIVWLVRYI